MERAPIICPACGELVIVWQCDQRTQVVPMHPDRISPFSDCIAAVLVTRAGRTLKF